MSFRRTRAMFQKEMRHIVRDLARSFCTFCAIRAASASRSRCRW